MADKIRGKQSSKSKGVIVKQFDDNKANKAGDKSKADKTSQADDEDNQADKKKKGKMGRNTVYTEELGHKICKLIMTTDMGLKKVCDTVQGMPAYSTVCNWLLQGDHHFLGIYARAKEQQSDLLVEQIKEIADTVEPRRDEIEKAKLRLDARKFIAAKLKPKKYGDKPELFLDTKPSDVSTTTAETIADKITRISELIANKPAKPTA